MENNHTTDQKKWTILVVDDEMNILRSVKRLLHRAGYHILITTEGAEAIEILQREAVAVLISDQRMPKMSGVEVLTQAYQLSPSTYRITLTGYTDMQAAQDSVNDGHVDQFLTKPWQDDHLLKIVQRGVEAYALVTENQRLKKENAQQQAELERWSQQLEKQVQLRTDVLRRQNRALKQVQSHLQGYSNDIVTMLTEMMGHYDPGLLIHSRRVASHASILGQAMDLDQEALAQLRFGALLHDLGRLTLVVPDQPKAASKTSGGLPGGRVPGAGVPGAGIEFYERSYQLLSPLHSFEPIAEILRCQNEFFNGCGQPWGVSGQQIPLAARMIAVANCFDEILFARHYPTQLDLEEAKEALLTAKGQQLDPMLVDCFLQCLQSWHFKSEVMIPIRQAKSGMVLSRDWFKADGTLLLSKDNQITASHLSSVANTIENDGRFSGLFVQWELTQHEQAVEEMASA